jgi:hypothetical protein
MEHAINVPLTPEASFPAPKGKKPMNDYRLKSGAWTGYAPRTTEDRWPTPPRTVTNAGWLGRFFARLFGR